MRRGLVLLAVLLPAVAFGGIVLWPQAELAAPLAVAAVPDEIEAATTALAAYFGEANAPAERVLVAAADERLAGDDDVLVDDAKIGRWVEDLRNDDIRWNATAARRALVRLGKGPVPALEVALRSIDLQQRQLAALVLRERCQRDDAGPSAELLQVCVEGLSHDVGVRMRGAHEDVAAGSARFLVWHATPALSALRTGLGSGDAQQRFLSAFLLAQAGVTDEHGVVARELVRHLGDNDVAGDALMAVHGLYRLGQAALPIVRLWRPHVDDQARSLLDLVELDVTQPPGDRRALCERRAMHRVTGLYHDPALEFDLGRSRVATFAER